MYQIIVPLQLFIKSGFAVNLYDVLFTDEEIIDKTLEAISGKLTELKEHGLLAEGQEPSQLIKLITTTKNLKEAITNVVYVQVSLTIDHIQ